MTKQPLKFTTVFGIAMIAIGLILEIGACFTISAHGIVLRPSLPVQ